MSALRLPLTPATCGMFREALSTQDYCWASNQSECQNVFYTLVLIQNILLKTLSALSSTGSQYCYAMRKSRNWKWLRSLKSHLAMLRHKIRFLETLDHILLKWNAHGFQGQRGELWTRDFLVSILYGNFLLWSLIRNLGIITFRKI